MAMQIFGQEEERVEYEQPVLVAGARTARKVQSIIPIQSIILNLEYPCLFVHPSQKCL